MTTTIFIKNDENSEHSLKLWRHGTKGAGLQTNGLFSEVTPGTQQVCHVWDGADVLITEGDVVVFKYKNPLKLSGPVFLDVDGNIRNLEPGDIL